jgi:hypothetical protein
LLGICKTILRPKFQLQSTSSFIVIFVAHAALIAGCEGIALAPSTDLNAASECVSYASKALHGSLIINASKILGQEFLQQ